MNHKKELLRGLWVDPKASNSSSNEVLLGGLGFTSTLHPQPLNTKP